MSMLVFFINNFVKYGVKHALAMKFSLANSF